MNLDNVKRIFMVGIGGAGMRALAMLLKSRGIDVNGSDRDSDNLQNQPAMKDYDITSEDDGFELLAASDVVIYSDAIVAEHPLRKYADEHHIESLPYQDALGNLAKHYQVIAVTGTHGKSSTTALLAHILVENDIDPNVLIGAAMPAWDNMNARVGKSDYLVLEADEYREHFLTLNPLHGIITTIDFDHPDYYKDLEHVKEAYNKFMEKISGDGSVVAPANLVKQYPDMLWHENTVSPSKDLNLDSINLALPGEHMRNNALLAITVATKMGVDPKDAAKSLQSFEGLSRRFEILGNYNNIKIVSDYGHHPEEIEATLMAAHEKYSDKKIVVIVEIHMPDRLDTFFDQFVTSLSSADKVIFAPVFIPKGRENADGTTGELLKSLIEALDEKGVSVESINEYGKLETTLQQLSSEFDVALCFSAGIMDSKLRKIVRS